MLSHAVAFEGEAMGVVDDPVENGVGMTFAIVLAFSISMAMLSWHFMERPLSILRHRIGLPPLVAQPT